MGRTSRISRHAPAAAGLFAATVAEKVLEARLGRIRGLLRAAVGGRRTVESVHELRVATRRAAAAARRLASRLGRFLSAAAEGAADGTALHALRISAKKTRYAIEIFAPAGSSPSWGRSRATLEHFQELAGASIDDATSADLCARWASLAASRADRKIFAVLAYAAANDAERARQRALAWLTPTRLHALRRQLDRLRSD